MITLPSLPAPNGVRLGLLDFGFIQRPITGAAAQRVDRKGNRFQADFTFPPMKANTARVFTSRLQTAKREGIRMEVPLLDVDQGSPGSPVVDGANQTGTSLNIRGLTPGYEFKEGFWLSILAGSGQYFLHNVRGDVTADGLGDATITIEPALRVLFPDGAVIDLVTPKIEGLVTNDLAWEIPTNRLVQVSFTMEEAE